MVNGALHVRSQGWSSRSAVCGSTLLLFRSIHSLLVLRADAIENFTEGSEEEREFALIAETLESYEARR